MAQNLKENHWTRDAKCGFSKELLTYHILEVEKAKAICKECPVQVECINWVAEIDGTFISAETSLYDRLLMQWKRIDDVNGNNFAGSSRYISKIVRRVRETVRS